MRLITDENYFSGPNLMLLSMMWLLEVRIGEVNGRPPNSASVARTDIPTLISAISTGISEPMKTLWNYSI